MESGSDLVGASLAPEASMEVKADGASGQILESGTLDATTIVTGAAVLLLTGSLAVVFVSVRRRRA
jgi:hypothetical protein